MNYIAEMKAFYDWLEINPLPSPAIVLWHGLMHIANKTGWQQEFTVATSVLSMKTGLNAKAIERARNHLEQSGRIIWKKRSGNRAAMYQIISLCDKMNVENVAQNVGQSVVPVSDKASCSMSDKVSVLINRNINETKKKEEKESFRPPSVEEVRAYCEKRGNRVDAERFVDFYASKGWMVGKNKMQDWRACVRTWEKGEQIHVKSSQAPNRFHNFDQRDTDYDALLMQEEKELYGGGG